MSKEKRKKPRRTIGYTAWIGVDKTTPLRGCVVSDISETGAKLEVKNPADLPITFTLLLSGRSPVYRKCQAVWRTEHHLGVLFEKTAAQMHDEEMAAIG